MSRLRHFDMGRLPDVTDPAKVTLIWIPADGEILFGSRSKDKVEILTLASVGVPGKVLAVWIGAARSDVFEPDVDVLNEWATQLGLGG